MKRVGKTSSHFPTPKTPPGTRTLTRRSTVAAADVVERERQGSQHARGQLAPAPFDPGTRSAPTMAADGSLPAIADALTCRQPYLETTPICHSRNGFAMPPVSVETVRGETHGFATAIGPESARCVRTLGLVPSGTTSLLDLRWNLTSGTVLGRWTVPLSNCQRPLKRKRKPSSAGRGPSCWHVGPLSWWF